MARFSTLFTFLVFALPSFAQDAEPSQTTNDPVGTNAPAPQTGATNAPDFAGILQTVTQQHEMILGLQAALAAAQASIEQLDADQRARENALLTRIASIEESLDASSSQNRELLTLTLKMSQDLAPLKQAIATLKQDIARNRADLNQSTTHAPTAAPEADNVLASLDAIAARVTALEANWQRLKTAPTVTPSDGTAQPTLENRQKTPASSSEPFELVIDGTGNPAIRVANQLREFRKNMVKASNCKQVGAWITPRTDKGDNAAFFVIDGKEFKVCRRIGEVWFPLKGEPEYAAYVVLQN